MTCKLLKKTSFSKPLVSLNTLIESIVVVELANSRLVKSVLPMLNVYKVLAVRVSLTVCLFVVKPILESAVLPDPGPSKIPKLEVPPSKLNPIPVVPSSWKSTPTKSVLFTPLRI
jgi:hypothetical protein